MYVIPRDLAGSIEEMMEYSRHVNSHMAKGEESGSPFNHFLATRNEMTTYRIYFFVTFDVLVFVLHLDEVIAFTSATSLTRKYKKIQDKISGSSLASNNLTHSRAKQIACGLNELWK